jgi:hypothetical protein
MGDGSCRLHGVVDEPVHLRHGLADLRIRHRQHTGDHRAGSGVEERARQSRLAGRQDHDLRRVLESRDVVAVERTVLHLQVREQRVVRVHDAVGGDVHDPSTFHGRQRVVRERFDAIATVLSAQCGHFVVQQSWAGDPHPAAGIPRPAPMSQRGNDVDPSAESSPRHRVQDAVRDHHDLVGIGKQHLWRRYGSARRNSQPRLANQRGRVRNIAKASSAVHHRDRTHPSFVEHEADER